MTAVYCEARLPGFHFGLSDLLHLHTNQKRWLRAGVYRYRKYLERSLGSIKELGVLLSAF